uniref:RNA-editing substrate-binding complex 7 protein domain-containing protein n=1 Tax=Lygus hesperus TaxID=30085 RepID=A0A0A9Y4W1_LYGHE
MMLRFDINKMRLARLPKNTVMRKNCGRYTSLLSHLTLVTQTPFATMTLISSQQLRYYYTASCMLLCEVPTVVNPSTTTANELSQNAQSSSMAGSALDVAMEVNKMKRMHQTGGSVNSKKQFELDAWTLLNSLSDEQINTADGKAVSLLLNS